MDKEEPPQEPPNLRSIKGGASRRGFVTLQIYTQLRRLYVEEGIRTILRLSKASGISKDTCVKATTTGWPERGWPPLRQLAAEHDEAQRKVNPQPIGAQVVIEAQRFKEMRDENITFGRMLRALGQKYFNKLNEALDHATAFRTGVHVRVIEERVGKRVVQRVVKENVRLAPSLVELSHAYGSLGQVIKLAGEIEMRFARYEPTDGRETPGWDALTNDQLDEIIANGGKLPDGHTIDTLRKKT